MANEAPQEQPTISPPQIPNFNALHNWFEKLNVWCQEAADDIEGKQDEIDQLESRVRDLEADLDDVKADVREWENFAEMVRDVDRGVCTFAELLDEVNRG